MGFMDGVRRGLNRQDRNSGGNGFNHEHSDSFESWDDSGRWNSTDWPSPADHGLEAELAQYREAVQLLLAEKERDRQQHRHEIEERDRRISGLEQQAGYDRHAIAERDRVIQEQNQIIAAVVVQRDMIANDRDVLAEDRLRAQASRDRDDAEKGEMEAFFKSRGMKRRLQKITHSDAHFANVSEAERRALDAAFVTLTAIYKRIEATR